MQRRRSFIIASLVATAAFSFVAAGCGGSGSPEVATVGSSTATATTTTQNDLSGMVAFSRCMRSHGVPNFPDPQHYVGGNVKLTIHNLSPSAAALNACENLLPTNGGSQESAAQQRTQLADELSFARCMRSHGVTRFPDPTGQGQLSVAMVEAQGIDVHSAATLRVVQTCLPASHGALTMAKVREAINNAGH
jgi:hypothetical protein